MRLQLPSTVLCQRGTSAIHLQSLKIEVQLQFAFADLSRGTKVVFLQRSVAYFQIVLRLFSEESPLCHIEFVEFLEVPFEGKGQDLDHNNLAIVVKVNIQLCLKEKGRISIAIIQKDSLGNWNFVFPFSSQFCLSCDVSNEMIYQCCQSELAISHFFRTCFVVSRVQLL